MAVMVRGDAALEPFAFAGIWEFIQLDGEEILSAAIVVGEPNPLVSAMRT